MSDNLPTTVSTQSATHGANLVIQMRNGTFETASRTRALDNSPFQVSINVNVNVNHTLSVRITESDESARNTDQSNAATPCRIRPARPAIYSTAANLLGFLPGVSLDALPDDSKNCIVCHEQYVGKDMPVRLQCDHVVGRECIKRWILRGKHTCPLCRQAMFMAN